ncbi:MAG: conjugal transfer protein [Streptosporangiaceae bacterium]|nr:conjugal transfer protein [Streptosporangiaceae bacterium]
MYGNGSQQVPDFDAAPARRSWGGGGGRWMVWPLRILLWVALLVVAYRGISAIVLNETPASTGNTGNTPASGPGTQFPVTLAEAYALQFGQVYLNFSPATEAQRAQQLAAFIPSSISSADPGFGWNGSGTMRLQSEQVASVDVRSSANAVVNLLASVNGQLMELGVPIYAADGGIVVSGEPAWLPAPSAIQPPSPQQVSSDQAAQSALMSQLPAFFQAYAAGDSATLNRFLAPGVSVTGLGGAVTFGSIANLSVPAGGNTREIIATVNWQLAGQPGSTPAQLSMTYDMVVVDQQSGKWYVKEIRASTQPMGTQ